MLKLINNESGSFVFDGNSLGIYEIPGDLALDIENHNDELSYDSSTISCEENIDGTITRLILIVTRACNLACTYCFADYVRDAKHKGKMPVNVGKAAIEKILTKFGSLDRIQFFGGEPLLVLSVIEALVDFCNRLVDKLGIQKPVYSITTNATKITDDAIAFFIEHNFQVTVSLDGDRKVNDIHRVTKQGNGSYIRIIDGIQRMKAAGITVRVETVYTSDHICLGESVLSTYQHIIGLGVTSIHLTPAVGQPQLACTENKEMVSEQFAQATEAAMDSFLTDTPIIMPFVFFVLESLATGKPKSYFCDAGLKGLTVDTNGDVYTCYTLFSDHLKMGNVMDEQFPGDDFEKVQKHMRLSHKDKFDKCVSCWAKYLCSACYGDSFDFKGLLEPPHESMCEIIRATTEAVINKVAIFRKDPHKWDKFSSNLIETAMSQSADSKSC